MPTKVAPPPARAAPRRTKVPGIVSSSHLVSAKSVELSELEFGLIVAWNAFSRWAVRCMAAAGCPELTITDVLVLHHICHRARNKKLGDICFVLNVEDTHVVGYSLKKLLAADLAQGEKVGKEVFYSPTVAGEAAVAKYREVRRRDDAGGPGPRVPGPGTGALRRRSHRLFPRFVEKLLTIYRNTS